jgi:hypothetical protein
MSGEFSVNLTNVRERTMNESCVSLAIDQFVGKRPVFQREPVSRPEAGRKTQAIYKALKMRRLCRAMLWHSSCI